MRSEVKVPISIGELIDKLSILHIKLERVEDLQKRRNIQQEFDLLTLTLSGISKTPAETIAINQAHDDFVDINTKLWDVEDELRLRERNKQFGPDFVKLARSVYYFNDKRAQIKYDINIKLNSTIVEEKDYVDYSKDD